MAGCSPDRPSSLSTSPAETQAAENWAGAREERAWALAPGREFCRGSRSALRSGLLRAHAAWAGPSCWRAPEPAEREWLWELPASAVVFRCRDQFSGQVTRCHLAAPGEVTSGPSSVRLARFVSR